MKNKPASVQGNRWAFMKRFDIEDVANVGSIYLTRWRIIQTPWLSIYLHKIRRPDGDRALHDHPWPFLSLILWGGYIEEFMPAEHMAVAQARSFEKGLVQRLGMTRKWGLGSVHKMTMGQFHSIQRLLKSPTWSLLIVGPRRRDWGFATPVGFVEWQTYIENNYGTKENA